MTIIVFDGTTMAADRAAWAGSMSYPVRKIYRLDEHQLWFAKGAILVGIAGHSGYAHASLDWFRRGGEKPPMPDSSKGYPCAIVVDQRRRIWRIASEDYVPEPVLAKRAVFGSPITEAMAMGVLLMGGSARTAVKLVIHHTDSAGLGIDVERLK